MRDEPIYFAPTKKLGGGWICWKDSTSDPANPKQPQAGNAPQSAVQQPTGPTTPDDAAYANFSNLMNQGKVNDAYALGQSYGYNNSDILNYANSQGYVKNPTADQESQFKTLLGGSASDINNAYNMGHQLGYNTQQINDYVHNNGLNAGTDTTDWTGKVDTSRVVGTIPGTDLKYYTEADNPMPADYYNTAIAGNETTNLAIQKAQDYLLARAKYNAQVNSGGRYDPVTGIIKGFDDIPDENVVDSVKNSADWKDLTGDNRWNAISKATSLLGINDSVTNDYGFSMVGPGTSLNNILMPGTPEYADYLQKERERSEQNALVSGDIYAQAMANVPSQLKQKGYSQQQINDYMQRYSGGTQQAQPRQQSYGGTNMGQLATSAGAGGSGIRYGIDQSQVPGLVGGDKLRDAQKEQQDAAYKMQTGYLDPMWNNQLHDLQTQLINQGIMQNSDAWNRAMDDYGRNKTFAYNQALNNSVQLGNNANQMLFNQGLATNQNAFNQQLQQTALNNSAQGQYFNQGLANSNLNNSAMGQAFNQGLAYDQNTFNQGLQSAYLNNASSQQAFNQSMQQRQQDINELLLQQNNPLNVLNALRTGSSVTTPTFGNVPGVNMAGTDYAGLINNAYNQNMSKYNSGVASNNSMMNGLFGLGSSAINSGAGNWLFNALGSGGTAAATAGGLSLADLGASLLFM